MLVVAVARQFWSKAKRERRGTDGLENSRERGERGRRVGGERERWSKRRDRF